MKKYILTALCIFAVACIAYAQSTSPSMDEFLGGVSQIATAISGLAATLLTEVFTRYTKTTKVWSLVSAIVIALSVAIAMLYFGIPSVTFAGVFTASTTIFALYKAILEATISK
jgi:hypothetical protein